MKKAKQEEKAEEKAPTADAMKEEKFAAVETEKDEKALTASGNMITAVRKQRGIQGGLSLNMEM